MTLTQGHISEIKFTVHTYPKSVTGHNSSLQCWIWIQSNLSYVTLQRRKEIRSHKTGGRWMQDWFNLHKYHCIWIWNSWSLNTGSLYIEVVAKTGLTVFVQLLSITKGYVMTLTQGHISKVNFTVHTYQKFGPGHNSSLPCWISIFHTIVVHDPTVFHDLDPRSYLQGQMHTYPKSISRL